MLEVVLTFIKEYSVEALAIWGAILTIASVVIKITPNKSDDKALAVFLQILNALALNPNNKEKERKELEDELAERDNDATRRNLTDALR